MGFVNGSGLGFFRPQLVKGCFWDGGLAAHESGISRGDWKAGGDKLSAQERDA